MSTTGKMLPAAVTMGEPSGIGGELTLMAWARRKSDTIPPFFAIDCPQRLHELADRLGLEIAIAEIKHPADTYKHWDRALPVLARPLIQPVDPGHPALENAPCVTDSIETAVECVMSGTASAIVTNPIHKETLYRTGFAHTGHTDFLAALAVAKTGSPADGEPIMMMATQDLRVVPVTIHVSLAAALAMLTQQSVVKCGRQVHRALVRDFGISSPRIGVTGLNPHAGEGGTLGLEEQEIIRPAIDALAREGIRLEGPFAADSIFAETSRKRWDTIICMYHDQALIPVKTLDFWNTVNITLGLPFIRTSPGHGTSLDLAGRGTARPTSFIAALHQAARLAEQRPRGSGPSS